MKGIIYSYTINNKMYIGKTYTEERKRQNKHKYEALKRNSNTPFARAIRKYGWENVLKSYKVIEIIYSDDKQELNKRLIDLENENIIKFNTLVPNGYNVHLSNHKELPKVYNKEEIYKKVSKSLKGKYLNNVNSKRIICIETNETFPSISEASRKMNISVQCICNVLKGKGVTAGGHTFKYEFGEAPRKNRQKKKVKCIELNIIFESLKDASEYFTGSRNQHSNISSAIKRNGTFRGNHFEYVNTEVTE